MNLGAWGEGLDPGESERKSVRKLLHLRKEELTEAHSRGKEFPMQGRRSENARDLI